MAQVHTVNHVRNRDVDDREVTNERLQYEHYGGFHFGAALFGWLVSTGIATILVGILAAGGASLAVTSLDRVENSINAHTVSTIGLTSGILFLIVLAISYFAGGYVAGRMSRFDGATQGAGVWFIGLIITVLLGLVGASLGAKYNILQQINLPHIPINEGRFTTGGIVATLVVLVVTILAAISGGRVGENYHRKIDAVGTTTADYEDR